MNGSSKEERDSWIEAIRKATPNSPRLRKDVKPRGDSLPKEDKRDSEKKQKSSSEKEPAPPHPVDTARQDTACDAAVEVSVCIDPQEEQKEIDEVSH
jgi:hypothetical protein